MNNEPQPTVYLIPSSQLPKNLPRYWLSRLGLEASKRSELTGMFYSLLSPQAVREQIFKTGSLPKTETWVKLGIVENWTLFVKHRTSALFYVKLSFNLPVKGRVKRNVYLSINAQKDEFYNCPQREWLAEYEFRAGVSVQPEAVRLIKHYVNNL